MKGVNEMKGLGLKNQDKEAPVALVKWKENAVAEAVDLCSGLKGFDAEMKVLVKPNLVEWIDIYPYAPFGIITTSVVLEAVIRVLKDAGAKHITVGDGCAVNKEFGSETHILQERLGYRNLAHKYGVEVEDFNQGDHQRVKLGPYSMRISQSAFDCDYLVNLPALKTHELTKITLGFKNLKGLLHPKTKKRAHDPKATVDDERFATGRHEKK